MDEIDYQPPVIADLGDRPSAADLESRSTEGLFGQDAELASAGFSPLKRREGEDAFAGDRDEQLSSAADELAASRPVDTDPVEMGLLDKDGNVEPIDSENADGKRIAIRSAEEAELLLRNFREAQDDAVQAQDDDRFLAELDIGDRIPEPQQPIEAQLEQPAPQEAPHEVDPIADALGNPVIADAIKQQLDETYAVRQAMESKLQNLALVVENQLASRYPELAGLKDHADLNARMQAISHANPGRAQFIQQNLTNDLQAAQQVIQANNQAQASKEAAQQAQRAEIAQRNLAQLKEAYRDDPFVNSPDSDRALDAAVSKHGLTRADVQAAIARSPDMSHPAFMSLLVDGLKYQQLQQAPAKAITKPVPPVQRPGVARGFAAVNHEGDVRALSQKLNQSGSIDDAMALLRAQRGR
jgi:hypothetical protein